MTTKQAQCLLCYLGYYHGGINGKPNYLFDDAIRMFQKDFGLTPTGNMDSKTEKALKHSITYDTLAMKCE